MQIRARAQAKINWSLDILSTREDGYHEMDMLMQRIELCDEVTFTNARYLSLCINGRNVSSNSKNLVLKAAGALCEAAGQRMGARIELEKRIPVRAGLGGGSADCAVALMALNRLWQLNYPADRLMRIGASLGADIPFCMEGLFSRVTGIGEKVEKLPGAPRIPLVLIMPEEGLSTTAVFSAYDAMPDRKPLRLDNRKLAEALRVRDFAACRALSGNALEAPAMERMPEVALLIEKLFQSGAQYAHMTGSGSCVFGAFRTAAEALRAIDRMGKGILTWTLGVR